MIDFDIQRCTRRCAASDRPFEPGETFFSLLRRHDLGVERRDYSRDAWQEPEPGEAIAWWRSRMPDAGQGAAKLAPNEVLLQLFDEWADAPERTEARYVLALLLVRRRVFRLSERSPLGDDNRNDDQDSDNLLHVDCPSRDATYELPVATPDAEHAAAIQSELNALLFADPA